MTAGVHQGDPGEQFPLAGRAGVFEDLLETLRTVRRGHVRTVVLSGPPGSGKTALLELFLEHCRSVVRGVKVLSATGDEWEAQLSLAGYSQLLLTAPLRRPMPMTMSMRRRRRPARRSGKTGSGGARCL